MPSTQSQSLVSKIFCALSRVLRGSPRDSAPEQIMRRSDLSRSDVLPVRAEPIRYTGRIEATGPVNAPAKDYAMADAMDSGVDELRDNLSKNTVSGRKYITWEVLLNIWRVRVRGNHVGYYRSLKTAVRWRNAYCRKHNIPLQGGD
jgi:hypothetical protein